MAFRILNMFESARIHRTIPLYDRWSDEAFIVHGFRKWNWIFEIRIALMQLMVLSEKWWVYVLYNARRKPVYAALAIAYLTWVAEIELLNGIKINYTCLHTSNHLRDGIAFTLWSKRNHCQLSLTTHQQRFRVNDPLEMALILFGVHSHRGCFFYSLPIQTALVLNKNPSTSK